MSQPEPEVVIAAESLTKVFADFWGRAKVVAVSDLSFSIARGEVFGLLGPNGAGKSTTVKLLLGLLRPTRGRVSILGRPPRDLRAKERLGYLPEDSHLYPYLTATETLGFFARLFDLPPSARRERIDQLLDMVGLQGARSRRVGEYSKGMARRLGLAQALLNDPDLVILDEPTAGLDPLGVHEVKDLIATLAGRGKTVLLCSHLLADVESVCDRVLILYGGRALAAGSLGELLAEPDTMRVTFPALSSEALAELLQRIRAAVGDGEVDLDTPSRSLESYFLAVVQAAQQEAEQPVTGVAPFLAAEPEPSGLEALMVEPEGQPEPVDPPSVANEEPAAELEAADASLRDAFGLGESDDG